MAPGVIARLKPPRIYLPAPEASQLFAFPVSAPAVRRLVAKPQALGVAVALEVDIVLVTEGYRLSGYRLLLTSLFDLGGQCLDLGVATSQTIISRLERGELPNPGADMIRRLSRALAVTSDGLIGMYEDEESETYAATTALVGA